MAGVIVAAELGINHSGNPAVAERMIDAAAEAGCDAVKVQSFRCADFLPDGHPDWDLFEKAEIWPWLPRLADHAHNVGLMFGVTPQSVEGVAEAVEAGADYLKNGSDCLLRDDMIEAMVGTGLPTWVSVGMADWDEIEQVPSGALLMLCTSLYPCPADQANVSRLAHPDYSGFSDHTEGVLAAVLAVSYGVQMVEKHFTMSKSAEGPDHFFSADPAEMRELVDAVRRAEVLVGDGRQGFMPGEVEGRERWRVRPGELRAA